MCNAENRELRGWMLHIINRARPYGASFRLVEETLCEMGYSVPENEIKTHLLYLQRRGYIHMEEKQAAGVMRRMNFVTPDGMDLLEGNIDADPGVMLVRP